MSETDGPRLPRTCCNPETWQSSDESGASGKLLGQEGNRQSRARFPSGERRSLYRTLAPHNDVVKLCQRNSLAWHMYQHGEGWSKPLLDSSSLRSKKEF